MAEGTHTIFPSIAPDRESDSEESPADAFARGACPWCSDYDGDSPKKHASMAHAKKYKALDGEG